MGLRRGRPLLRAGGGRQGLCFHGRLAARGGSSAPSALESRPGCFMRWPWCRASLREARAGQQVRPGGCHDPGPFPRVPKAQAVSRHLRLHAAIGPPVLLSALPRAGLVPVCRHSDRGGRAAASPTLQEKLEAGAPSGHVGVRFSPGRPAAQARGSPLCWGHLLSSPFRPHLPAAF